MNGNITAATSVTVDANSTAGSASVIQAASTNILAGGHVSIDGKTAVTLNGTIGAGTAIGGSVTINTARIGSVNVNGNVTAKDAVTIGTLAGGAVTIGGAPSSVVITADSDSSGAETLTVLANGAISQQTAGSKLESKTGDVLIQSNNSMVSVISVTAAGANQLSPAFATDNTVVAKAAIQIRAAGQVTVAGVSATGSGAIVEVVSDNADIQLGDIAATASVFLQAANTSNGAIVDANGVATNVTAANLAAVAGIGIGSTGGLETKVSTLAARNSTSGNILLDNSVGAELTIGTVGSLSGVTNSASNPATVAVTNLGALTVAQNVTANGPVTLTASDTAATGDNLTINAGVAVQSNASSVTANAGDNFTLDKVLASTGTVLARDVG